MQALRLSVVFVCLTVYKDVNTPSPFIEDFTALRDDGSSAKARKPDHIYMDCMGFGMGNCCLQVTFQACNIDEAKTLYDQLAVMCPIMVRMCSVFLVIEEIRIQVFRRLLSMALFFFFFWFRLLAVVSHYNCEVEAASY